MIVNYDPKSFIVQATVLNVMKLFYNRNLRIFGKTYSICPSQPDLMFVGRAKSLP